MVLGLCASSQGGGGGALHMQSYPTQLAGHTHAVPYCVVTCSPLTCGSQDHQGLFFESGLVWVAWPTTSIMLA